LHVIDPAAGVYTEDAGYTYDHLVEVGGEHAQRLFDALTTGEVTHGRALATETAVGSPTREILSYADRNDIDQIVIGSHGRSGVTRVLLGSVAEAVVRRAPVPVTVVR
jgi:nucleotide-binding universal stress UspA family protein